MKHPYFVPDTVQEDKTEDVDDMVRFILGHEIFNNEMYHDTLYNVLTEYEKTKAHLPRWRMGNPASQSRASSFSYRCALHLVR